MRRLAISLVVLLAFMVPLAAGAEDRVALVIGNAAYKMVPPLRNPGADATQIGKALTAIGYDTTVLTNADKAQMAAALAGFTEKLRGGATGFFYFSGHATGSTDGYRFAGQMPGDWIGGNFTFLLPIDLSATSYEAIMAEATELGRVFDALRQHPGSIGVIDTHLFTTSTRMPAGVLMISAVPPNGVALDGDGDTSPLATGLVKALGMTGLDTDQVFALAARLAAEATHGAAVPWVVNRLPAQRVLNGGGTR